MYKNKNKVNLMRQTKIENTTKAKVFKTLLMIQHKPDLITEFDLTRFQ